ncbi:rhodanese-like domain-containing protein [Lentisphaera profundi]|uniref:Rhodanese-like domain-containing protein n=1 Tax=Lentisphaera profundi TaxID=1658616 RepID=A0ABY7VXK9_9BACT|nr:rhodanese-like domain-containing protein [Lentisphaera profundi]WDE98539.1 rhodanese-like domain-containing protein [Lentisphaera profundi]
MKKILFVLLLPLFISVALAALIKVKSPDAYALDIKSIDLNNYLIIDARSLEEYKQAHIDHAQHANVLPKVQEHINNHALKRPLILVYCNKRCSFSRHFSKRIREELNYENTFYLKDGYQAWFDFNELGPSHEN